MVSIVSEMRGPSNVQTTQLVLRESFVENGRLYVWGEIPITFPGVEDLELGSSAQLYAGSRISF